MANKTEQKKFRIRVGFLASVPLIVSCLLILTYFWRFGLCLSGNPVPNASTKNRDISCLYNNTIEQWGQAGDFFGGILNPIIGLITVLLVVYSIRQNQKALEQNELALKQNEKALTDSHNELKNSNSVLSAQKHLMESEYRERCLSSILESIRSEIKSREITSKELLRFIDQKSNEKINDNVIMSYYLTESFENAFQYFLAMQTIYEMESDMIGKRMLLLRIIASTSIEYISCFFYHLISTQSSAVIQIKKYKYLGKEHLAKSMSALRSVEKRNKKLIKMISDVEELLGFELPANMLVSEQYKYMVYQRISIFCRLRNISVLTNRVKPYS